MKKENLDYIICKICGEKVQRIYGAHLKKHDITSQEYKERNPNSLLTTVKDKQNTSKNSGKHMKQEKYKKMFSDKIKGEKNPNHKSKTTEQERKERSPFSKEFYKNNILTDKEIENILTQFREKSFKNRVLDTQIEYYLRQGYSEKESKKLLKKRQTTFSKEICIQKYGQEKGIVIFNNRQNKWNDSMNKNGNMKGGFSIISQKLFFNLLEYYKIEKKINIYFATKNKEIKINGIDNILFLYDFTDLDQKKIIEYNGDLYHANPKIYENIDTPHPFRKNLTAEDIWKKDGEKLRIALLNGFQVLTIWDSEYKKDKENTIKKCLKFLNLNNI